LVLHARRPHRTDARPNGNAARHLCFGVPHRPQCISLPFPMSELTAYVFGPTLDWLKTLRRCWSEWPNKIRPLWPVAARRVAARAEAHRVGTLTLKPQGLDRAYLVRIPSRTREMAVRAPGGFHWCLPEPLLWFPLLPSDAP
jgi:hypothetical protein